MRYCVRIPTEFSARNAGHRREVVGSEESDVGINCQQIVYLMGMERLQMAARLRIGGHSIALGQAIGFFLVDPRLPRLSGCRIFARKCD